MAVSRKRSLFLAVFALLACVSACTRNKGQVAEVELISAAGKGDLSRVRALLDAKADVNAKAGDGSMALIVAAREGHVAVVRALLYAKADVNARDNDGETALIAAAEGDVVQTELEAEADVNAKHNKAVRALLDAKADVNAADNNGETALIMAAHEGHADVVGLLKNAGARDRRNKARPRTGRAP
jgi:ankyrin repeat protein